MYTILIVDDEDGVRSLYSSELEEDGYEVVTASDRVSALKILASRPVHLVVLDIKLRGESGLRLLQEITSRHPRVSVILSTAYRSYRDDSSSWAADAYVVKSSNLDELKFEVAKSLDRRFGATIHSFNSRSASLEALAQ